MESETSRCPEAPSAERYHRRRELAEVRKDVKVPGSPSSKERGRLQDSKHLAWMKAAGLWVAPGEVKKDCKGGDRAAKAHSHHHHLV